MVSPRLRSVGTIGLLAVAQLGVRGEARGSRRRPAAGAGDPRLVGGVDAHLGEALVADEDLGSGVLHDVGDLGCHQVVVDRHDVPPGLHGREVDLEYLGAVGQHEGDGVALVQPELAQCVHDLVGATEQFARLEFGAVRGHESQVPGLLLRHRPEPEVGHPRSLLGFPREPRSGSQAPRQRRRSPDAPSRALRVPRTGDCPPPAAQGRRETRTCSRCGQAAPRPACAARRHGSWRSR